jgi:hypothetical protein
MPDARAGTVVPAHPFWSRAPTSTTARNTMASPEHDHRQTSTAAAAPPRPAQASAASPRSGPLSHRDGIRTGVHWRPGPASAWRFMTGGASRVEPQAEQQRPLRP